MENQATENQNTAPEQTVTTTTETTKPKKKPNSSVFAVLQNSTTGEHQIISEKQKKDLAKKLSNLPDWKLIGSFKGKQLSVQEKKSFNFN